MKAKTITKKGNLSNSEYCCIEIEVDDIVVVFRLSGTDYMKLWVRGFQYEDMREFMDEIAGRINHPKQSREVSDG